MHRLALVTTVLALAMPGHAAPPGDMPCSAFGNLADTIMRKRQDGATLEAMLTIVRPEDSHAALLVRDIVLAAYARPRYRTEDYKARAVLDFRNDVQLECIRSFLP